MSEDEIIENVIAILNSPEQRAMWQSYNLFVRNCEQFAVLCCTSAPTLGCQISACLIGTKCVFMNGARVGIKAVYDLLISKHEKKHVTHVVIKRFCTLDAAKGAIRIGEKLGPSSISAGAVMSIDDIIRASLKGTRRFDHISF